MKLHFYPFATCNTWVRNIIFCHSEHDTNLDFCWGCRSSGCHHRNSCGCGLLQEVSTSTHDPEKQFPVLISAIVIGLCYLSCTISQPKSNHHKLENDKGPEQLYRTRTVSLSFSITWATNYGNKLKYTWKTEQNSRPRQATELHKSNKTKKWFITV